MSTLNFNIDDYYVPGTDRFSQWRTKYNSLLTTVGVITSTVNTELFGTDGTGVIAEMQSDIGTINAELFGTSGSESGVIATLRSDVEYLTNRITTLNAQVNDANLAVISYGNSVEQANQQIASLSASLSDALSINSKIVVALLANGIDINDPQATPAPTEAPSNTDLTGSWLSTNPSDDLLNATGVTDLMTAENVTTDLMTAGETVDIGTVEDLNTSSGTLDLMVESGTEDLNA